MLIAGSDSLAGRHQAISMLAFRSISDWHRIHTSAPAGAPADVATAIERRDALVEAEETRVLMVQTEFGEPL